MSNMRPEPKRAEDERTTITEFLDFHRSTVVMKVGGLTDEQARRRLVPSATTALGIVKHLAYVEHWWFRCVFEGVEPGEPWASAPWGDDPDWDFHSAEHDRLAEVVVLYERECERSRAIASIFELDDVARRVGRDETLRWILVHMIEETARHNGHLDLLRELLDGTVGA